MTSTDPRTIICGILAGIALLGAIILGALEKDPTFVAAAFTASGTFGGYVVGLYSSPHSTDI